MTVLRAFIAVDISPELKQNIQNAADNLAGNLDGLPVRWVPADKIHLTLKFLGDVSETNMEMIAAILTNQAQLTAAFDLSIGSLGVFPTIQRPRVVWIGIEAPDELGALQRRIEAETTRLGYPAEKRPFSPHLTLGRVSRNVAPDQIRAISTALRKQSVGFLGVSHVKEIALYSSDLQPEGAIYTRLHSAVFPAH